ncbi:MAG: cytochrome c [Burkholderiales bacterium]|nr:cytochrome c [Burkholderiales bacterium]
MNRLLAALAATTALAAHAQAPAGDASRGKALYMKNMCYTCHGTVGQGGDRGSGPRIAYDVWPWEAFAQQTRRPRESMPRYPAEHVSDQDLADIYVYVASFKRGAKAADIPLLKE